MFAAGMSHEPHSLEGVQKASKLHKRNGRQGPRIDGDKQILFHDVNEDQFVSRFSSVKKNQPIMSFK
jgi:hypothetical protein